MLTMCVIIRVFTYVTAQGHWLVFAGPAFSGRLCPKCPHLLPELFFPHPGNGLLFVLISLLGKYGSGKHKFKFYFHCRHCLLLTFVRILLRPFGVFFLFENQFVRQCSYCCSSCMQSDRNGIWVAGWKLNRLKKVANEEATVEKSARNKWDRMKWNNRRQEAERM